MKTLNKIFVLVVVIAGLSSCDYETGTDSASAAAAAVATVQAELAGAPASCSAESVITSQDEAIYIDWTDIPKAQTLTLSKATSVAAIEVYMQSVSAARDIVLNVYADKDGNPDMSKSLGSVTLNVGLKPAWVEFSFASPVQLSANQQYWFVYTAPSKGYFSISLRSYNFDYTLGKAYRQTGVGWQEFYADHAFRLIGCQ